MARGDESGKCDQGRVPSETLPLTVALRQLAPVEGFY